MKSLMKTSFILGALLMLETSQPNNLMARGGGHGGGGHEMGGHEQDMGSRDEGRGEAAEHNTSAGMHEDNTNRTRQWDNANDWGAGGYGGTGNCWTDSNGNLVCE